MLVPVNTRPRAVNFGQVPRDGSVHRKKVTITRGDAGPLTPKLAPIEIQGVEAQLKEIEAGERYELEVTLTPPFKSDRLRGSLKLETGLADAPNVSIPLYGTIAPRVTATPRRFSVPKKREGDWQQSVRLVWHDGTPHKIVSATVNDPKLNVRVDEKDNGQQQVVLEVPADYTFQSSRRTVVIQTDDAETPRVRVPISFRPSARSPRAQAARASARVAPVKKATAEPDPLPPTSK